MKILTTIAMMMLVVSMMTGTIVLLDETEASNAIAPVTRYVGGGDSTYSTIQDAIDDAEDGDTITIAAGDYGEDQLSITKDNLLIQGNITSTGVRVTSSVSGPCLFLQSVTNVTIKYMNFSHFSNAARVYDSDNITFEACVFWSTGNYAGSLYIDNSENITVAGDLFGGALTLIHSEGDKNPAIKIDSSEYVVVYFAELESDGDLADSIACYNTCDYIAAAWSTFIAAGTNSNALLSGYYYYGMLMGIDATYTNKMISLASGYVEVYDITVPDGDVSITSSGVVDVMMERAVKVIDENDMPVEGVDLQVSNEKQGITYQTEHWGGDDPQTDEFGEAWSIPLLTKSFNNPGTPNYGENMISVFYDGGDIPVSVALSNVDANITDDIEVQLEDFEAPDDAQNLEAVTVSHEQIDLSFEASPSTDVEHYEIWLDSGSGFEWNQNQTDAGTYQFTGLIPETEYSFNVIAVDEAGIKSGGVMISNTTLGIPSGYITGTVTYTDGPMDGMPAEGATVSITDPVLESVVFTTTNETGYYMIEDLLFKAGYLMTVEPVDVVVDGGNESGYTEWKWTFDHTADLEKDVSLPYYAYDSDDVNGKVVYSGGPMDGINATNVTVKIYNETMVEIASTMTNETTGTYLFEDVDFGVNYTIKIDGVDIEGTETGYAEFSLVFDHDGMLELNISIEYFVYDSDDIHGQAVYSGGPMDGMNATNATVILYNETMVEIASIITNETTGMYLFEDVPFGINYTIKVDPVDAVVDGGDNSGYIAYISGSFNHTGELKMDISIEHYTYVIPQPTTAPVYGTITFGDGPKEGEAAAGCKVSLIDTEGGYTNTTTNETGGYLFEGVAFGSYSIKVFPVAADLGETDVRSGYMAVIISPFNVEFAEGVVKDAAFTYYTFEEPTPVGPTITILDENGDPVKGVKVTADVNGTIYEAITDEDGKAAFDYDGEEFPAGTTYTAEKDGFDPIEWNEGESVPELKEEKEDSNILMFILIAVVLVIVILVIFLLIRKKGDESEYEE